MNPSTDLTIVTTVTSGYAKFLPEWAASLAALKSPAAVGIILGNGLGKRGRDICAAVENPKGATPLYYTDAAFMPCGQARNLAVGSSATRWVMHLDADDTLLPDALETIAAVGDDADVIQLGYEHWWPGNPHGYPRKRLYEACTGLEALDAKAIASGCSPFRKSLWEQWRYPEQLEASWDYGLWLGFAHLGARFRPTKRPVFKYRQWGGSHWRRVGQHRHENLLALRRCLEADFAGAQQVNLLLGAIS
jgi:hypothetical protein